MRVRDIQVPFTQTLLGSEAEVADHQELREALPPDLAVPPMLRIGPSEEATAARLAVPIGPPLAHHFYMLSLSRGYNIPYNIYCNMIVICYIYAIKGIYLAVPAFVGPSFFTSRHFRSSNRALRKASERLQPF